MAVNIWFSRKTAKEELKETLFFSGMDYGEWSKDANGYSIQCSVGKVDIRSMYDVRVNGKKVGSATDFKRVVADWIQRG
jgi:hypothetical protein